MRYLFLLLLPLQLLSQKKSSVLFRNVNVVDVQTGKVLMKQNVLILGERIEKISPNNIAPANAKIIDGNGKFLIPGLWDMHVHVFNNVSERAPNEYYHPLFIANGVLSVREMWTKAKSLDHIKRWRTELSARSNPVPRYVSVGTLVDGAAPYWPKSDTVTNAEEARTMVHNVKNSGVDFLKVYGKLSREAYFAIAEECKKLQFPFAGHVPLNVSLAEASNAGQKSQEHLGFWEMFIELSDKEEKFRAIKLADLTPALRLELLESLSEVKSAFLANVFEKNNTSLCPTTTQYRVAMLGDDEEITKDDRLQYVDSFDRKNWVEFSGRFKANNRSLREIRYQKGLDVIKLMHKGGVRLLAGTDLGNPYLYAGFSLHDELKLFVDAGLSPLAALQTATINPAKYVGRDKELGTVTQGKFADLILLDANPLTDILNTKKISSVVINGKLMERKDLDNLLEQAREAASLYK